MEMKLHITGYVDNFDQYRAAQCWGTCHRDPSIVAKSYHFRRTAPRFFSTTLAEMSYFSSFGAAQLRASFSYGWHENQMSRSNSDFCHLREGLHCSEICGHYEGRTEDMDFSPKWNEWTQNASLLNSHY